MSIVSNPVGSPLINDHYEFSAKQNTLLSMQSVILNKEYDKLNDFLPFLDIQKDMKFKWSQENGLYIGLININENVLSVLQLFFTVKDENIKIFLENTKAFEDFFDNGRNLHLLKDICLRLPPSFAPQIGTYVVEMFFTDTIKPPMTNPVFANDRLKKKETLDNIFQYTYNLSGCLIKATVENKQDRSKRTLLFDYGI